MRLIRSLCVRRVPSGGAENAASISYSRSFRKHATWYTKEFPGNTKLRDELIRIESLAELDAILVEGDPELHFPPRSMRSKRGKKDGRQKVVLPEGFRDDLEDATPPAAEEPGDGG